MAIDWKFDFGCMQHYDLDSDQVDAALAAAGLTRETATLAQAADAVRAYAVEHHYNQPALPSWI